MACLAFGRAISTAAEVADLHIERADPGRRIEHLDLQFARHIPGSLTRTGGIDDEQEPGRDGSLEPC
jgi:hypothetical protein